MIWVLFSFFWMLPTHLCSGTMEAPGWSDMTVQPWCFHCNKLISILICFVVWKNTGCTCSHTIVWKEMRNIEVVVLSELHNCYELQGITQLNCQLQNHFPLSFSTFQLFFCFLIKVNENTCKLWNLFILALPLFFIDLNTVIKLYCPSCCIYLSFLKIILLAFWPWFNNTFIYIASFKNRLTKCFTIKKNIGD